MYDSAVQKYKVPCIFAILHGMLDLPVNPGCTCGVSRSTVVPGHSSARRVTHTSVVTDLNNDSVSALTLSSRMVGSDSPGMI